MYQDVRRLCCNSGRSLHFGFVLLIIMAPICTTNVFGAVNELTDSEKKSGWKLLFDGKSLASWRSYKKDSIGTGWKIQDAALTRSEQAAGDIITKDKYDSFELSIEYNISPGGNSGIMFHVTEEGSAPWHTGPEIQVQDNVQGKDGQKAGWLYQLYQPGKDPATNETVDATRPAGQWNQIHLRVTKTQCEINVNGIRYAQFQKGSKDWDDRVAKSKFSKFAQFGKATSGHICLQDHGNLVAYRNIKIRSIPENGSVPDPIDGLLPLKVQVAFPDITWAGWNGEDESGRPEPMRPVVIAHGNDGSNRLFVANQWGEVYSFVNSPDTKQSKVFVNLRDRVMYKDRENEEGFLGMAFHPKFKDNGQFFIYYTTRKAPHTSVISRFKVSATDPTVGDPNSEEELVRIPQPFWNHNGGTLAFGLDGHLYIGLGDGGAGNDPFKNGQNLGTWLGSILRIDVDHKDSGKAYAVPKDNPFLNRQGAQPEIYAYGFRNIWRLTFDRETGDLWCGDVGQNLWEEIDIVVKGGYYGWNLREGIHPFGSSGADARSDLIDPIWEYDHQTGKSITGGHVYRGKKFPELFGKYVYADYVTGKIWALKYDKAHAKVVSNEQIPTPLLPVITFGEDEQGEIYFGVVAANGKGIYRFSK